MNHLSPSGPSAGRPPVWAHCSLPRGPASPGSLERGQRGHFKDVRQRTFAQSLGPLLIPFFPQTASESSFSSPRLCRWATSTVMATECVALPLGCWFREEGMLSDR